MPKPTILTQDAFFSRVARFVEQGYSAREIAEEIGCTLAN
jgi:hypothetical protein